MEHQACSPQPTAIEEDEMDMLQSFSKHGSSGDPYAYDMDLEGLDAVALDRCGPIGVPRLDRKNQADVSQKSESPPRDAPDSPSRDEAMPAATVTMDTSRGRPQTRERHPDDRKGGSYSGGTSSRRKHPRPSDHRPTSCGPKAVHENTERTCLRRNPSREAADHPPTRSGSCPPRTNGGWSARASSKAVGEDCAPDRGARRHARSRGRRGFQAVQVVGLQAVGEYIHSLNRKTRISRREQCGLVSKIVSIAALARRKHDRTESTTRLDYEQLFLQSSMPMAVAALRQIHGLERPLRARFGAAGGFRRRRAVSL